MQSINYSRTVIISVFAILVFSAAAQDKKVAVFDPIGDVSSSIKEIVRESFSAVIVNTAGYTVLERQLIDKVLEEYRLQLGGLVDDNQIVEMGKMMGANLAFVSSVSPLGDNLFISGKLIDIQTGRIEMQKTAQTMQGSNDLLSVVQTIGNDMFGGTSTRITGNGQHVNNIEGSEDYALLHIYRPWGNVGATEGIEIYLNNEMICNVSNQSKVTVQVNRLGNNTLGAAFQNATIRGKRAQLQNSEISVNIEYGREYYIRIYPGIVGAIMSVVNNFRTVSSSDSASAMPTLEIRHNTIGKSEFDEI